MSPLDHAARRRTSPEGSSNASADFERSDASQIIGASGQALLAQSGTTFVFTPGFGQAEIDAFRLAGPGHDTIELPSSDFASFAQVLLDTRSTPNGAIIHDTASGDTLLLAGISKSDITQHKADFLLHA